MKLSPIALILTILAAQANDVVFLTDHTRRPGEVQPVFSGTNIILTIAIAPPANRPDLPPAQSRVSIPLDKILHIEFAPRPEIEKAIESRNLPTLEKLWALWKPWNRQPRSPAPRIGLALAEARLAAKNPQAALELFREIETSAWDAGARELARPGRLRALIAQGRAEEAVNEAAELAKISEDPALLIEANHIRAEATAGALRQLLEDNPRWQEDIYVIPERNRLYHQALDLYLNPALFQGHDSAAAARGLWGAIGVLQIGNELEPARELARDLLALYADLPQAKLAADFLASLPEELRAEDPEKEYREQISDQPTTTHEKS